MPLQSQIPTDQGARVPEIAPATQPGLVAESENADIAPIWLQRLSLFVLVLFCVYLGVLVAILPWWKRMWDQNLWIQSRPALAASFVTSAVRRSVKISGG